MKQRMIFDEITKCPECNSSNLAQDYGRGELVCNQCGLVIDDIYIDHGPEWRAFDSEQHELRARTGAPIDYTAHNKGFNTIIGWENRDSYGKSIPLKSRAQLHRLRRWQFRIRNVRGVENNLASALPSIDRIISAMELSRNVREAAIMIYRRAVEKNLVRGRSIAVMAAAAIYAACRQCGTLETLDEFSELSDIDRKDIGRTYRFLARELQLRLMPTSPQDYVSRFCTELGLSEETRKNALDILQRAEELELTSGKGPTGIAAAAIYIASVLSDEHRIQREVADVAGVTEVTIRNRYKEMADKMHLQVIV